MENQVVIITGAANGIGKGVAKMYAEQGAKVVLADIDVKSGEAIAEKLGPSALFQQTDVRKAEDIIQLMKKAAEHFGKIDVLINNTGKGINRSPYDLSIEEWDDVVHTNLRSTFLCSREAAKYMREAGGAIVNIASTRALMSEPNSEAYAASKGGILALTHALAASFSDDRITVNAISPGWIETGDYSVLREIDHTQHFSGRVGKPDDIARACLYLTNPENDFVTGINLVVDGGMTRKMMYVE
ncbi:SDR family oxidoreductase [Bacillus sp. IITD106]|nr:SDR family oxidoreductase [Bacillus sp. IITD106]